MSSPFLRVNDTRLQSWLSKQPERNEEALRLFRNEGSRIVIDEMKSQAPGGIGDTIISHDTPLGFSVYPTAPHAIYVVRGTRPHIIEAKDAQALRFFPSKVGFLIKGRMSLLSVQTAFLQPVFAKRVKHPGTKPNDFVRRTAVNVKERLIRLTEEIWRRVFHH